MFSKPTSLFPAFRPDFFAVFICSLLAAAPLCLVTIGGWASGILFASGLGSFLYLMTADRQASHPESTAEIRWVGVTLLLPIIAISVSSCFRGTLGLPLFDSPSRFLIAIPIFLFVVRKRVNIGCWLQYTLPLALVIILGDQYVFYHPYYWGGSRMATYFADPLTFGQYSMTLGLMCLISINRFSKDSAALLALKIVGFALGIYFSVQSGSRTGWLAAPIVIGFYILERNRKTWVRNLLSAVGVVSVMVAATYLFSPIVHERVGAAWHDLITYNWIGVAPETSIGRRITFLRIGIELLAERPLAGFGDHGFASYLSDPRLAAFASPAARDFVVHSGFHNELMTNAVRSGVWGVLSTLALFIVPCVIFSRALRSASRQQSGNALMGLTFVICQLISGMSTEVLNLKFTASFYAVVIACLCGASLVRPVVPKVDHSSAAVS